MIGREDVLDFIKECIKHKHSLIITGRKGIGKTTLLKFISKKIKSCYVEFASTKPILEALIEHLDIPTEKNVRYMTASELLDILRPYLKKKSIVLLLDEANSITKYCGRILDKLAEEKIIIIGVSEKKVWSFKFRKQIELLPLNRQDSKEIAQKLLGNIATPLILDLIATKSLGVPGKIKEICNDIKTYYKNLELNTDSQKSVFKFFKDIKPEFPDRINILPLWMLFVIGFGFLMLRYYFYSWGDFNEGYLLAMFGYTSLIIYRLVTVRKYEK